MKGQKLFIDIGKRRVGPHYAPLVVAEIGINHGGDLSIAKEMVKAAALSGCECVKHQTHFVEDEMTIDAKSIVPPNSDISIWEIMENCSLSKNEELELKNYTENLGLIYISTPFSRAAVDFLDNIGVPAFKIGSGECNNHALIEYICQKGKPVIMSTGMQSIEAIHTSVTILKKRRVPFALLECTNLYPSPPETVSLAGVKELQREFPNQVIGFSDHSIGPEMSLASIALGACLIERHFTDTKYREGPDISCSMDPSELKHLILKSKEIWVASKNSKKRHEKEEEVYRFARSSIIAEKNLSKGDKLTADDIWAKRPGNGEIAGFQFDQVIGKTLTRALIKDEQLKWSDLVEK